MSEPIHHEVVVPASAERVYDALTDAERFSELSGGAPAEIDARPGGAFSLFGGMIEGRFVELEPSRRVVQAWRVGNWPPGLYSLARFELDGEGEETRVVFDHTGFPDAEREHLESGWHKRYWEPLKQHLGS